MINKIIKKMLKEIYSKYRVRNIKNKDVYFIDFSINENNIKLLITDFKECEDLKSGEVLLKDNIQKYIICRNSKDTRKISKLPEPFKVNLLDESCALYIKDKYSFTVAQRQSDIYTEDDRIFMYTNSFYRSKIMIKKNELIEYISQVLIIYRYDNSTIEYILNLLNIRD